MKKITNILALLLIINLSYGQTTLAEGDIAITGYNAGNPEKFSFVLLKDIVNTTEINFTDKSWRINGGFRLNNSGNPTPEGIVTWTADADYSCGTEIIITKTSINSDPDTYTTTIGSVQRGEQGFALNGGTGDQITVFQGTLDNPTFLYAIHFANTNGWTDAINNTNSAVPAGLTEGVNAIDLGDNRNGNYNGTVTSNQALILAALAPQTNWTFSNTTIAPLGGHTYTCTTGCASTVTWNGAWIGGTPDLTTAVIIDANYNSSTGNFSACEITVNAGSTLTVEDDTYIEVENNVTINGDIIVENQGNFVQNDINGTFILDPAATAVVNKTTATKQAWYYYTYWSSPVSGQTIAGAFPNTDGDRRFWFNATNYLDTDGDDIDDDNNDWTIASGASTMTPGVGYAITSSRALAYPTTDVVTFSGPFNTGDVTASISFNAANMTGSWNLIGNPYPTAIDFIAFQQANSTVVDGVAYFWSQSSPHSNANPGNQQNNFNQNDYATFTIGTGGAAGASGIIPDNLIASGQSFFISGLATNTATFTNAMRMPDGTSNTQFFKNSNKKRNVITEKNKLWINLTSDNGAFNQILIGYVAGATNADDGLFYDAPKFLANEALILYSRIPNSTKKFTVQGKAENSLNAFETIPLGFKNSINVPTIYKLEIAQLQGAFFKNNPIFLKDNLLDIVHDLSNSHYSFTSNAGEFNDRFEIVFNASSLATNETVLDENTLKIITQKDDKVQFISGNSLNIKSVTILDLLGKQLYHLKGNSNSEILTLSNLKNAVYIAKVQLSNEDIITRKIFKK